MSPRDAELNLPPELYSHGVQRRVAEEVTKGSFDQAGAAIASTTGTTVPKRQLEELTARAAMDFDGFDETRSADSVRQAGKTGPILVLSTDGKGICMRPESLREATQKAAAKRDHKMSKRLSPGEKRNCKRMAQVATVFTIAAFVRKPEDIVSDLGPVRDTTTTVVRPRPEHKRVWASVAKSARRSHRTDVPGSASSRSRREQALGRPGRRQSNPAGAIEAGGQAPRRTTLHHHLDVIHVLEYLWDAGFAMHGEGAPATQRWVSQRLLEILRGNSSDVAAGMRRSATLRAIKACDRAAIDDCANYLLKYRDYLHYEEYLAGGLPIATGVIEGACRHLIKDRMDITGACWGLDSAEAVLKLCSLRSSADFEEYWTFHENAEHIRNHLDLYQGAPPTTILPLKVRPRGHLRLVD